MILSKPKEKYGLSIATGLCTIFIFFILPTVFQYKEYKELINNNLPTVYAIGGLLFSIAIKLFWDAYKKPYLKITGVNSVKIMLQNESVVVSRVIVENEGRTAAVNCKGYFVTKTGSERVCWSIPSSRATITINAKDKEKLDFCGFSEWKFFIPTENGWDEARKFGIYKGSSNNEGETTTLYNGNTELNPDDIYEVLITAENADPVSNKVILKLDEKKIELQG